VGCLRVCMCVLLVKANCDASTCIMLSLMCMQSCCMSDSLLILIYPEHQFKGDNNITAAMLNSLAFENLSLLNWLCLHAF
jgi:hypothetical protein